MPLPEISPLRIPRRVGSLEATTIPMHRADPTKKTRILQTKDLKAGGRILRGLSVSAAVMEMYSGPVMLRHVSKVKGNRRQTSVHVRKTSLIQARQDTQEFSCASGLEMLDESPRVVPVSEPVHVV